MKIKFFNSVAVAIAALVLTSCGSGFGKLAMDSEEAVNKVKEVVSGNIDTNEWKIVEIDWDEGTGDAATLENNMNNGGIFAVRQCPVIAHRVVRDIGGRNTVDYEGERGLRLYLVGKYHRAPQIVPELFHHRISHLDEGHLGLLSPFFSTM